MISIRKCTKITEAKSNISIEIFQLQNLELWPQFWATGCAVTSMCLITDVQNKPRAIFKLEASFALLEALMGSGHWITAHALKQQVLTLCPRMPKLGTFLVHGMFSNFLSNAPWMAGHLSVFFLFSLVGTWHFSGS